MRSCVWALAIRPYQKISSTFLLRRSRRVRRWSLASFWFFLGILLSDSNLSAITYLKEHEALELAFENPSQAKRQELKFDASHCEAIEKKWGESLQQRGVVVYTGPLKSDRNYGVAFFDAVIGKHEFIDYMLVLNKEGTIQFIEILSYRESYGGEIRNEAWRKQFSGKSFREEPEHKKNIINISGATLSCRHVTEGVRKLLAVAAVYADELGLEFPK